MKNKHKVCGKYFYNCNSMCNSKKIKRFNYHNPNLGLATKARAYEVVNQEWSSGVTFHAHENVGEWEGMNPHTPKWSPILGIEIPMYNSLSLKYVTWTCTICAYLASRCIF